MIVLPSSIYVDVSKMKDELIKESINVSQDRPCFDAVNDDVAGEHAMRLCALRAIPFGQPPTTSPRPCLNKCGVCWKYLEQGCLS